MVIPGVDILIEERGDLKSLKLALLTNQASISSKYERSIDLLLESGFNIVYILAPEHGFYITGGEREGESEKFEKKTGIPIISLYPPPDYLRELEDIDAVLVDLQDVGARFYTYITSLRNIMYLGQEQGFRVIVLDRPNPVTGVHIEGPLLDMRFSSFVGPAPIPVRHGLTIGEVGELFRILFDFYVFYEVIEMRGWKREMWYDETGLPFLPPSPNIPNPETALYYLATCFLEGTNVSEGRGTSMPFQIFGAPWLNTEKLLDELEGANLEGVKFLPYTFVPRHSKFSGETCEGIKLIVTNREKFKPVKTGLYILKALKKTSGRDFEWIKTKDGFFIDRLTGTDMLRKILDEGGSIEEFIKSAERKVGNFLELFDRIKIYR